MVVFSEEFLSENQFEGVLVIFCCSDYGVNVSKTVERIDTSNRFINAFCALQFAAQPNILSAIRVKKFGYQENSEVDKKLQKLHRRRSKNWSLMSFIHSRSEIRIQRVSSGSGTASQIGHHKMLQPTFNFKDQDLTDKVKLNRCKSPWIDYVG